MYLLIFLVDIHSVVIQMQMDLNPFLRFSTEFSAFLLVPCTHYFLAICGLLTPDFMYWHINHINATFEGFWSYPKFLQANQLQRSRGLSQVLAAKTELKMIRSLCEEKKLVMVHISVFQWWQGQCGIKYLKEKFFLWINSFSLGRNIWTNFVCVFTRNHTSYHHTEL